MGNLSVGFFDTLVSHPHLHSCHHRRRLYSRGREASQPYEVADVDDRVCDDGASDNDVYKSKAASSMVLTT